MEETKGTTMTEVKTVYKTEDGTTFESKAEAEAYVALMKTPHVKKLMERVEQLENDIRVLRAEIACMKRPPAIDPTNPFQRPQITFDQKAWNTTTATPLFKED